MNLAERIDFARQAAQIDPRVVCIGAAAVRRFTAETGRRYMMMMMEVELARKVADEARLACIQISNRTARAKQPKLLLATSMHSWGYRPRIARVAKVSGKLSRHHRRPLVRGNYEWVKLMKQDYWARAALYGARTAPLVVRADAWAEWQIIMQKMYRDRSRNTDAGSLAIRVHRYGLPCWWWAGWMIR